MHRALPLALTVFVLLSPAAARADRTRAVYAGFGAGPLVLFDDASVHGRFSGEFGFHFGGTDLGFVMALEAVTSVSNQLVMFHGGVRLGGDIEIDGTQDFGVVLRPSGFFGAGFLDRNGGGFDEAGYVVLQPALDVRLLFADRAVVFWLRPAAFDVLFFWRHYTRGDWYIAGAYQAMAGFDFQF